MVSSLRIHAVMTTLNGLPVLYSRSANAFIFSLQRFAGALSYTQGGANNSHSEAGNRLKLCAACWLSSSDRRMKSGACRSFGRLLRHR